MARVPVTPSVASTAGIDLTTGLGTFATGANNGISIPWSKGLVVVVQSTAGAAAVCTIIQPLLQDGVQTAGKVVTVTTGTKEFVIGPFPSGIYQDSNGKINIDCDTAAKYFAFVVNS